MIAEIPYAVLITGAMLVGLYLANYFYDEGVEQYISRKVGHGVGGMGFLLCVFLFSSAWWSMILAGGFTLLLGGARLIKPQTFRGVGGTGRQHALAEVYFPAAGTISLGVGWVWLGNPWLGVVPILFIVTFATFTLARFGPGDPVRTALGQFRDEEAFARIRAA